MSTDDPPPQPKTLQMPAVDPIAEIKGLLVNGFKTVKFDMDLLSGQIDSQGRRISELEAARQRASDRARALASTVSSSDLSTEAKLGELEVWRQTVATKEDLNAITSEQTSALSLVVKEAVKSPLAKQVGTELARFIIAALTLGTAYLGYLAMKGHL